MTYGMKDTDFQLRELEEIALQIGDTNTAILTDDDGVDLDDDDEYQSDDHNDIATITNPFVQLSDNDKDTQRCTI